METNKDISKLISFLKDNAEDGFTKEDFLAAKVSIKKEKLLKNKKTNEDLIVALDKYIQKKYDTQLATPNITSTITEIRTVFLLLSVILLYSSFLRWPKSNEYIVNERIISKIPYIVYAEESIA